MWMRMATAAALALTLGACSTAPTRVALDRESKQKFDDVVVVNTVYQDEMIVRAAAPGASAAMGGGLIGALIDSKVGEGRQNTIDQAMAPFYSAVDDLDFRARLTASLKTALADKVPLKIVTVEQVRRPMGRDGLAALQARFEQGGRGALTLMTSYTFTPDYRVLTATTTAVMRRNGVEQPLFLNTYTYLSRRLGEGGAGSIAEWTAGGGARYRNTIDQAAEQIAAMLQLDLASAPVDPAGAPRVTLARGDGVAKPVAGPQLASGAGRAIVRDADGHLFSLPQTTGGQP
jgi:hypothetical protein